MKAARHRPALLHNMSVPPLSQVVVRRSIHPGRRFCVDFTHHVRYTRESEVRKRLAKRGWQSAWAFLEEAGDAPWRHGRKRKSREILERHLGEALRAARVPERVGVFIDGGRAGARRLGAAAALAVLCRRSGRLYLPTRGLDPSLADPGQFILFFPEVSP